MLCRRNKFGGLLNGIGCEKRFHHNLTARWRIKVKLKLCWFTWWVKRVLDFAIFLLWWWVNFIFCAKKQLEFMSNRNEYSNDVLWFLADPKPWARPQTIFERDWIFLRRTHTRTRKHPHNLMPQGSEWILVGLSSPNIGVHQWSLLMIVVLRLWHEHNRRDTKTNKSSSYVQIYCLPIFLFVFITKTSWSFDKNNTFIILLLCYKRYI